MGVSSDVLFSCLQKDLTKLFPTSIGEILKGSFWPGMTNREAAAVSISNSLLKKLRTGMTDDTRRRALEKFLQVNSACENWSLQLSDPFDDILVNELKMQIDKFWYRDGYSLIGHDYDCLDRGTLGPGSSIGARGNDFYTKLFSSPLTCTSTYLYDTYKRYIKGFPEWTNAENIRSAHFGEARIVEGNHLSFVPKNDDISRSICTEPTLNMMYQLGAAHIFSSRLRELWGVNLETQQFKNRELARKGSLDESFVTIDLSSASDSISTKMLRCILPAPMLALLERFRCPRSKLPNGTLVPLHMISTMGNGLTFPLQTVIFTAIVIVAMRCSGLTPLYPRGTGCGNFGVFGDDIICPVECHRKVLRLLKILGFQTNGDKTFVEGPFRESCGADFWKGINIRGVYVKSIQTQQDRYSVINQLNLFSTRTGILLPQTVQYLLRSVKYLPVPQWENDDSGIKVPFSIIRKPYRLDRDTQSILYTCMRPRGLKIRISDTALFVPRSSKPRIFNLSGLLISFLQGSVQSGSLGVRHDVVRYTAKRCVAANWDHKFQSDLAITQVTSSVADEVFWQRWETSVYLNLFD